MLHSALFKKMKLLRKIALDILKRGFVNINLFCKANENY